MAEREPIDAATEDRVGKIMKVAIDELGGLTEMTRHRQLEILPAIIEAGYILVLHEERHASAQEIADRLGTSRGTVESVFESPLTDAMPRIQYASREDAPYPSHTEPEWIGLPDTGRLDPEYLAGAAAKFAYSVVRRREGMLPPEPGVQGYGI